jgi:DNA (cytosine-5)-methyltransferase 1
MAMASSVHTTTRSRSQISETMSRIGSKNTTPEKSFRKALRRIGIRSFKICDSSLPGKPDVVLPRKKTAVFIDGDFWHGNQYKLRGFQTLKDQLAGIHNSKYWAEKISRNVERDLQNTADLLRAGWRVLRLWESQIRNDPNQWANIASRRPKTIEKAAFSSLPSRTVVELFAGIGLVRLALDKSGWKTVFANDNDLQKFEMYRDNFGSDGFDTRSIHELSAIDIPTCGLMTASFPCNDLSLAGARAGLNGEQSSTFWGMIKLLSQMRFRRPPIVLLENVAGFISSHGGKDLEDALLALNDLGYSCDLFLMNASWFVPQSRVRLFIIGKQVPVSCNTKPSLSVLRPKALIDFIALHPNIAWDFRDMPGIIPRRRRLESIIQNIPESDPRWWSRDRSEYFINQLSQKHRRLADFMISGNEISYATAFRRVRHGKSMAELRVDGTAGCLRTPRGGSGRQILFEAGKRRYRVRLLTPRECARLQGVSDDTYKITIPDNKALFGFGDAVCVPVVQWIAENYLNPLASELIRGRVLDSLSA